jgi:hypothetical protein
VVRCERQNASQGLSWFDANGGMHSDAFGRSEWTRRLRRGLLCARDERENQAGSFRAPAVNRCFKALGFSTLTGNDRFEPACSPRSPKRDGTPGRLGVEKSKGKGKGKGRRLYGERRTGLLVGVCAEFARARGGRRIVRAVARKVSASGGVGDGRHPPLEPRRTLPRARSAAGGEHRKRGFRISPRRKTWRPTTNIAVVTDRAVVSS